MALAERSIHRGLVPILDDVASTLARLGMKPGSAQGANAVLRVELEENVKRIVQVYWTPFEANVPDASVGLHLEVAEPTVHWAEAYLSPHYESWYFAFMERADGDVQLTYQAHAASPQRALELFVKHSAWYVLTPTGVSWSDVVYEVSPALPWTEHHRALAETEIGGAVQEALKKSTIVWLRWSGPSDSSTMPVWFVMNEGKIYVLSGERQQTIPGAKNLRQCDVIVRWKGKNARVAELPASVRVLPHGPEWDAIAEKIAEKRLNIPGVPEDTARRWRDECDILELTLH